MQRTLALSHKSDIKEGREGGRYAMNAKLPSA